MSKASSRRFLLEQYNGQLSKWELVMQIADHTGFVDHSKSNNVTFSPTPYNDNGVPNKGKSVLVRSYTSGFAPVIIEASTVRIIDDHMQADIFAVITSIFANRFKFIKKPDNS